MESDIHIFEGQGIRLRLILQDADGGPLNPADYTAYGAACDGGEPVPFSAAEIDGNAFMLSLRSLPGGMWQAQVFLRQVKTGLEWLAVSCPLTVKPRCCPAPSGSIAPASLVYVAKSGACGEFVFFAVLETQLANLAPTLTRIEQIAQDAQNQASAANEKSCAASAAVREMQDVALPRMASAVAEVQQANSQNYDWISAVSGTVNYQGQRISEVSGRAEAANSAAAAVQQDVANLQNSEIPELRAAISQVGTAESQINDRVGTLEGKVAVHGQSISAVGHDIYNHANDNTKHWTSDKYMRIEALENRPAPGEMPLTALSLPGGLPPYHVGTYTVAQDEDLSALVLPTSVDSVLCCELEINVLGEFQVIWPESWEWLEGGAPYLPGGYTYVVALRYDSGRIFANVAYSFDNEP